MLRRSLLLAEYGTVFLGLPVLITLRASPIPLFPVLWTLAAICLGYLLFSKSFDRRRLWGTTQLGPRLVRAAAPFVVSAPFLALWTWLAEPEVFLAFVRSRPVLWAVVMVLYPVLSVYPQGIVYRVFVFERYREVFGDGTAMVVASAVAFAAAHLIFRNWIGPGLTLAGGLLFAWTYRRTGSSIVAGVQHALFGGWLFTTGLGVYFYYGAVSF